MEIYPILVLHEHTKCEASSVDDESFLYPGVEHEQVVFGEDSVEFDGQASQRLEAALETYEVTSGIVVVPLQE